MLAAPAASAAVRPLDTGVSYVYDDEVAVAFQHVKAAGAGLVHTPIRWGDVAPGERPAAWQPDDPAEPRYDWESTDRWVREAVAAGLTPVLQIRGAPRWAQRCAHAFSNDSPCDLNPADLSAFATAAARRYSGAFGGLPRVQYWQGLNEPNLSLFFLPQFDSSGRAVSAELYRTLLNTFYGAIKGVDPTNVVIAAGLGPIAVPKFTIGPMRFTRELLCMKGKVRFRPAKGNCGGGVNFDIFAIHPYTTGGPTHEGGANDVQLGSLWKLKALLRAADEAGRINSQFEQTPLWITEFSWDSQPPDPGGLPMKIETRWAAEAMHTAWRVGIDAFFWFTLRDQPPEGAPSHISIESGLYFRGPTVAQDQPKEVLFAFRFPFVAHPHRKGLDVWGRTPNGKGGRVMIQILRDGKWRKAKALRADSVGIFRGRIHTGYGRNRRGAARAVYKGQDSVPFAMRSVGDFPHPPFGRPVG
ncbi:MAG TPA: hypothetical protein VEQ41_06510 [Solirubrobacterales bacterium]|nr:hypothetical protein [Solirubrobacterales bacterium]